MTRTYAKGGRNLVCPLCGRPTCVTDSRSVDGKTVRRRRRCQGCKHRFTTFESVFISVPALGSSVEAMTNRIAKLAADAAQIVREAQIILMVVNFTAEAPKQPPD